MLPGTRVRFKASHLRSMGVHPTDDLYRLQGTVVGTREVGHSTVARVRWDDDEEPKSALTRYLQPVGKPESF